MPIQNPRVPDYVTAETNTRYTQPNTENDIGWVNNSNNLINWNNNSANQIDWFVYGTYLVDPSTGIPIPGGNVRVTQNGNDRVTQQTGEPPGGLNQEPGTNPNVPGNDDPGLPYNNTDVPKTGPLDQ
jgi:signal peptidase I